jgi:hypothetical protein
MTNGTSSPVTTTVTLQVSTLSLPLQTSLSSLLLSDCTAAGCGTRVLLRCSALKNIAPGFKEALQSAAKAHHSILRHPMTAATAEKCHNYTYEA